MKASSSACFASHHRNAFACGSTTATENTKFGSILSAASSVATDIQESDRLKRATCHGSYLRSSKSFNCITRPAVTLIRRKSAVERLEESKAQYVKSEQVRDARQMSGCYLGKSSDDVGRKEEVLDILHQKQHPSWTATVSACHRDPPVETLREEKELLNNNNNSGPATSLPSTSSIHSCTATTNVTHPLLSSASSSLLKRRSCILAASTKPDGRDHSKDRSAPSSSGSSGGNNLEAQLRQLISSVGSQDSLDVVHTTRREQAPQTLSHPVLRRTTVAHNLQSGIFLQAERSKQTYAAPLTPVAVLRQKSGNISVKAELSDGERRSGIVRRSAELTATTLASHTHTTSAGHPSYYPTTQGSSNGTNCNDGAAVATAGAYATITAGLEPALDLTSTRKNARPTSSISRSKSDIGHRLAKGPKNRDEDLDRFFATIGLDSSTWAAMQQVTQKKEPGQGSSPLSMASATTSTRFFDSVDSFDSAKPLSISSASSAADTHGDMITRSNKQAITASCSRDCGQTQPKKQSLSLSSSLSSYGLSRETSIVEKNARVIKWLYNCRKATSSTMEEAQ